MGCWPDLQNQLCVSSLGLKSNQRVVGYPHNSHTTLLPMNTPCRAGHYCSSQGSQLNTTVDGIFLPDPQQLTEHSPVL